MIKSETINHEGNAGPNWLDKCRQIIGPSTLGAGIVIVVVLAVTIIALHEHRTGRPAVANTSLQSSPSAVTTPLTVSTLIGAGQTDNQTTQQANAQATPQSVDGLSAPTPDQPVGPAPTDSLSQLQSAGNGNIVPSATGQVQQTVEGLNTTVLNTKL